MDQPRTIETILNWLRSNVLPPQIVKCDHVTCDRQELPLFLGEKLAGTGRGSRIAQVDLIVCDQSSQTVNLIIEVDPNPNPKKVLGDILAVLLADNYTPSNEFQPFKIKDAVFVYVTVLPENPHSQKAKQFRQIEAALQAKLDLRSLGIHAVHLCHASTEEGAVERFRQTVEPYLSSGQLKVKASVQ